MQPRLRFKGFTDTWIKTTIGSQANIVRGASPRPIKDPKWFDKNSNVGWLRISDVTDQDGRVRYIKQRISRAGEAKTRVLDTPHLILSIAATVGEPAINYVKTGIHDGFITFLNPKFSQEYMFQWLKAFKPQWRRYGQPGSQLNLNSTIVSDQKLFLPLLREQYQIGRFFAKLDKMISLQQSKLDLLKKQKKGYLQKLFPKKNKFIPNVRFDGFDGKWNKTVIGNVAKYRRGSFPQPYGNPKWYKKNGYPFVQVVDVGSNFRLVKDTNRKISKEAAKNSMFAPKGTILITIQGSIGRIAISQYDAYIDRTLLVITGFKIPMDKYFFMLSMFLIFNKEKRVAPGGTIKTITKHELSRFILMMPSLSEQRLIGNFFKRLDNDINLQNDKLCYLRKLKKAYLQKMFC